MCRQDIAPLQRDVDHHQNRGALGEAEEGQRRRLQVLGALCGYLFVYGGRAGAYGGYVDAFAREPPRPWPAGSELLAVISHEGPTGTVTRCV